LPRRFFRDLFLLLPGADPTLMVQAARRQIWRRSPRRAPVPLRAGAAGTRSARSSGCRRMRRRWPR
jgi:hypothetical protein